MDDRNQIVITYTAPKKTMTPAEKHQALWNMVSVFSSNKTLFPPLHTGRYYDIVKEENTTTVTINAARIGEEGKACIYQKIRGLSSSFKIEPPDIEKKYLSEAERKKEHFDTAHTMVETDGKSQKYYTADGKAYRVFARVDEKPGVLRLPEVSTTPKEHMRIMLSPKDGEKDSGYLSVFEVLPGDPFSIQATLRYSKSFSQNIHFILVPHDQIRNVDLNDENASQKQRVEDFTVFSTSGVTKAWLTNSRTGELFQDRAGVLNIHDEHLCSGEWPAEAREITLDVGTYFEIMSKNADDFPAIVRGVREKEVYPRALMLDEPVECSVAEAGFSAPGWYSGRDLTDHAHMELSGASAAESPARGGVESWMAHSAGAPSGGETDPAHSSGEERGASGVGNKRNFGDPSPDEPSPKRRCVRDPQSPAVTTTSSDHSAPPPAASTDAEDPSYQRPSPMH